MLGELAHQLDDGRIYSRDLLALSVALNGLLEAFTRRGHPANYRQGATSLPPGVTSPEVG